MAVGSSAAFLCSANGLSVQKSTGLCLPFFIVHNKIKTRDKETIEKMPFFKVRGV